jgi:hypothetical protein
VFLDCFQQSQTQLRSDAEAVGKYVLSAEEVLAVPILLILGTILGGDFSLWKNRHRQDEKVVPNRCRSADGNVGIGAIQRPRLAEEHSPSGCGRSLRLERS